MFAREPQVFVELVALLATSGVVFSNDEQELRPFPSNFQFGTGSSAYQIEGGWDADGKGPSYWDFVAHNYSFITKNSTGDVACDSYHKYREDISMLKEIGVHFYKFSISWPRILPQGTVNNINQAGVEYYNNLIDGLVEAGIEPYAAMYHWDTPFPIYNNGHFGNPDNIRFFEDYADLLFSLFGDRVKNWITFNEPLSVCAAFNLIQKSISPVPFGFVEYDCAHNILLAHANVYHLYQRKYKSSQCGRISINLNSDFNFPASDGEKDTAAAERKLQFDLGWFAHPLYIGDYPPVMKTRILQKSLEKGLSTSRLPEFTTQELLKVKGSVDFLTLNHYSSNIAADNQTDTKVPSREEDLAVITYKDPRWAVSQLSRMTVVPEGFRYLLRWVKTNYGDIEIVIGENGYPGDDETRIEYHKLYIDAMLDAIHQDGVRVTGYAVWSLMDSFEWNSGYTAQFGLYHVDFNDPNRTRTPKPSVQFYRNLISSISTVEEMSNRWRDRDQYCEVIVSGTSPNNNKIVRVLIFTILWWTTLWLCSSSSTT